MILFCKQCYDIYQLLRNIPPYEKQFSFININLSGDTILFKSPEIKLSDEIVKNSPGGRGYLPSINSGWKANGCFNFYDSMTDSIYAVSGDGYQARYQIFRGDYGMSPEKYFSTEWSKTISEKGWEDYIKPMGFTESFQYIYINLDYKDIAKESHWARFDKKNGEVKWWRNKFDDAESNKFFTTRHFYNDFDGGPDIPFPVNEQYLMSYITEPPTNGKLTPEDFVTTKPLHPNK